MLSMQYSNSSYAGGKGVNNPVQTHSNPAPNEYSDSARQVHLEQLGRFFDPSIVANLETPVRLKAFQELSEKPFTLALTNPYGLGHLSYAQYSLAFNEFRAPGMLYSEEVYQKLLFFINYANQLYCSGYRLHGEDVTEDNPAIRTMMYQVLCEMDYKFNCITYQLYWPVPYQIKARLIELCSHKLAPAGTEHPSKGRGTWIVDLDDGNLSEFTSNITASGYYILNFKQPPCSGLILEYLANQPRVCFLHCNPTSLIFWITLLQELNPLEAALFCFDPDVSSEMYNTLGKYPILDYASSPPLGYLPEFNPADGLKSPVFQQLQYFTPISIRKINVKREFNPAYPIHWLTDSAYGETVKWFVELRQTRTEVVTYLTNTQHETECIWEDCKREWSCGDIFINMQCTLSCDPLRPMLSIIDAGLKLYDRCSENVLGSDFGPAELEQLEVSPLSRMVYRNSAFVFYFSNSPITRARFLELVRYSVGHLVIVAPTTAMHELTY